MARTVYLHVGLMKSGTSFLQQKLQANTEALAAQGILFPGEAWRDQVRAVQDVLGTRRDGAKPRDTEGAWRRLLDELAAWDGDVVISMELLAAARPRRARRIVASLRPAQVHVVVTARDLGRTIPAMWQESMQTSRTWTWREYLTGITEGDRTQPGPAYSFWRQQDVAGIVRKWRKVVGRRQLSLVTLPPPGAGPDVLWQRFCTATGIDPIRADAPGKRSNESLGAVSAEVMRRLNGALESSDITWGEYSRFVKHPVAKQLLAARRSDEPPIGFTRRSFPRRWVQERAAESVARLARMRVRVIGDLADLEPVRVRGTDPAGTATDEQLDAAVAALAAVVQRAVREDRSRPAE